MELKLDYKKTIKVGFAFAIIILFWQVYDFVVPLLLEKAFGLSNFWRGAIMGLDNLLSLFMLPLFGKLSDKSKSRFGRRTPFIFIGTILSCVLMVFIPITANKQLKEANALRYDITYNIQSSADDSAVTEGTSPADGVVFSDLLASWYDAAASGNYSYISQMDFRNMREADKLTREDYISIAYTPLKTEGKGDAVKYFKGEMLPSSQNTGLESKTQYGNYVEISKAEYDSLSASNTLYNKYAANGVATYLSEQVHENITVRHAGRLVIYLIVLLLVLISMGIFRSPAVALMPDVTPKPLRSQANAIINLAGGVGGAIAFIIYTAAFLVNDNAFIAIYLISAVCMLILLALFMYFVKETAMVKQCEQICEQYGITDEDDEEADLKRQEAEEGVSDSNLSDEQVTAEKKKLEKAKFRSFLLILASIFMWFMGYNAVSSNLSVYCVKVLGLSEGVAGIISGVSMGISAIAFIPVGMLAVKIGRKKSIILGFALAVVSYVLVWIFVRPGDNLLPAVLFAAFYLIAGFGLIIANVNTFPMVVELSKAQDVGKYTGYYYMATMSAQAITPAIAGLFMDSVGNYSLFGYSAVCVVAAIAFMALVRHGDSKPLPKKSVLENFDTDD